MAALGTLPSYQYEKLPDGHIRLLRLRPGPRSGMPAILEIFSCLLEDSPEYEALSYVWDKPLRTRPVAFGEDRQIRVPVNVFLALKWLQRQTSERLMWIDAICINQDQRKQATEEREDQVKMMGRIYAKAKTVFIHFGASAARYDAKSIGQLISWLQSDEQYPKDSRIITLAEKVGGEEYFQRTWTIQEVILAKEVFILFRDSLLPWSLMLSKSLKLNFNWNERTTHTLARIPIVRVQRLLGKDRSPGLLDVLRATATSKATDPRDKIYALHGLIEGDTERYPVKYDMWTAAMVFAYYTFRFCKERNSLDVLETSRHIAPTSIDQLPSWAKDFTHSEGRRRLSARGGWSYSNSFAWFKTRFCAHGHLPLSIKLELGQDLALDSQGRKVGEIIFVSRSKLRHQSELRGLKLLSEHLGRLTDPARPFVEWNCILDFLVAFLCTQVGDPGDSPSKLKELVREEVRDFSVESGDDLKSLVQRLIKHFTEPNSVCSDMAEHMLDCCKGNTLFTTDNPFMGSGSDLVLPGDIVCVLNGGRMPFILRRTNTAKNEYELVCECYIYGIMQGEWMQDVKEDGLEWFRLV